MCSELKREICKRTQKRPMGTLHVKSLLRKKIRIFYNLLITFYFEIKFFGDSGQGKSITGGVVNEGSEVCVNRLQGCVCKNGMIKSTLVS